MIGLSVTDETGKPLEQYSKLSKSAYQPSDEVKRLYAQCQNDYMMAYRLQHRPFDEFDGVSVLQRAYLDQQTWGAFVGAQYVPQHKSWRFRGRKNTARNNMIRILAQMISGMLYPYVNAQNEDDEPDKMTARVMRMIVEQHLRKAQYETKFLYMVLTALVNPAVFVEVDYLEAWQRIKDQTGSGKIIEAIDTLLTGLHLNIIPIDQMLLADFYTNDVQRQPYIVRVERISWDQARKIYGHHPDFKYVEAGKTRIVLAGQEHLTLYDIEWTEGDRTQVQVIHCLYRDEDLEATFVAGVFMGNGTNVYNTNPFKHRRLSLLKDQWVSVPFYKFAKSYYEPIDPTGRFAYGKSCAFKLYWDDKYQNVMHQLFHDATYLDTITPLFLSGIAKTDSVVIAPGATVGMPPGAAVTPFKTGANIAAAMQVMQKQEMDEKDSTSGQVVPDTPTPNIQATQIMAAQQQAKLRLGVLGIMIADLVRQIGDLTIDCVIQHTTVGEIDASVPSKLRMKYKTVLAETKTKGKTMTNRIIFNSDMIEKNMTKKQIEDYEWRLWDNKGGDDQEVWHVNPYKFARMTYSMFIDPDEIINHAMGNKRQEMITRSQMLSQPFVYPFVDKKELADSIIEDFSSGDPDRFKMKGSGGMGGNVNDLLSSIMGNNTGGGNQGMGNSGGGVPSPLNMNSGGGMVGAPGGNGNTSLMQ